MNLAQESTTPILEGPTTGPAAWTAADIRREDWLFSFSADALGEIRALARQLKRNPVPLLLLNPDDYAMPACRAQMAAVRQAVFEGVRFAVVEGLPLDEIGDDIGRSVYWLLSSLVAKPVAQKLDGSMVFDVRDYGLAAAPGSGVRPAQTNLDLVIHNDNAYNTVVPEVVGLLCLYQAKTGGVSRTVSFHTIHNRIRETCPEILPVLYRAYEFDRQREHWPDEPNVFEGPIFRHDGRLSVRMSAHQIYNAYAMRGQPVPEEVTDAIRKLEAVCAAPELSVSFRLSRGALQYVNNREIGHARTEFVEHDDPALRRHLVRLWLRRDGCRSYTSQ